MYLVVSKWTYEPSQKEAFRATGRKMRAIMRGLPGVEILHAMDCEDGNSIAIVGYKDKASYERIMADGGPFEKAAKENAIEGVGKWVWSERGEEIDQMATA